MIKLFIPSYKIQRTISGLKFQACLLLSGLCPILHCHCDIMFLSCLVCWQQSQTFQDSASSIDIPRYFILSQSRCVDIYKQGRMCFSSIVLHWHCYCMRNIEKYSRWLTMPKVASIGLKPDFSWIEYFPWACDLGSGPPLALPTCLTGCVHLYTGQAR